MATLECCAQALEAAEASISAANEDLIAAKKAKLSSAMVDRLKLGRLKGVIADLRAVAAQHDPVGRLLEREINQGLKLQNKRAPEYRDHF